MNGIKVLLSMALLLSLCCAGSGKYASPVPFPQQQKLIIVAIGDSIVAGHPGAQSRLELEDFSAPNLPCQAEYWITQATDLPCFNQGISGQTSGQILQRWGQDVLDDGTPSCFWPYKSASIPSCASVIWLHCGNNDIGQGVALQVTENNITAMIASAQTLHIPIFIDTVGSLNPGTTYDALNTFITTQAGPGVVINDYKSFFAGQAGWFSPDGIHPSPAGYEAWGNFVGTKIANQLVQMQQ
jgi:lysophospholipase L1-like esterase